ncbi:MAG: hypothetical protein M5U34_21375 [Chloroflexi bacterium]|nr:hypothetical protein [Chloroflexota bacterium]
MVHWVYYFWKRPFPYKNSAANLESWGGNGRYPHHLALTNETAV